MSQPAPQLGKYRILGEVGRGGFATVYRALDTSLGREVALKLLHPALLTDSAFVSQFHREASTVAGLDHPHIVPIHEVDQREGRLYIAMKLVRGGSLAALLHERGPLPWDEALAMLRPICAALDYAHGRGVVHRDFKPANVLIDEQGTPFVSDFGFARSLATSTVSSSLSQGVVGTPSYIAPEVWDANAATPAVDIYALGCTLYEMLTGRLLFAGDTPMQAMRAHDRGPQYPERWPPGVPNRVTAVLNRALDHDPARRYPSAGALLAELEGRRAGAAPPPPPRPTPEDKRRLPVPLLLGGGVALALAAGLLFTFAGPMAQARPTPTSQSPSGPTAPLAAAATTAVATPTRPATTPPASPPAAATPPAAAQVATTPPAATTPFAIATSGFNLRAGPGTNFPSLGEYRADTRLDLTGREPSGRWLAVRVQGGGSGGVSASLLRTDANLSARPLVTTPTPPPPTATRRPATPVPPTLVPPTPVPPTPVPPTNTQVPPTPVPPTPVPPTSTRERPTDEPPPPPTATPAGPYGSTVTNPGVLGAEQPFPSGSPLVTVLAVVGASAALGLRQGRRGRRAGDDER